MKAVRLRKPGGFANLYTKQIDVRDPGPDELLVRLHASSLNYHDYMVVSGIKAVPDGLIPMTDGAGIVIAAGENIRNFTVGDRVISVHSPGWQGGAPSASKLLAWPGDRSDGYAREMAVMPAGTFTQAPQGYTHTEAATLPAAALTAWRALVVEGNLKAGDTVLVQGSGGVSIFALQFARMFGATVIATSSSDSKLERMRKLGAQHLINYKRTPAWSDIANEMTGGQGVDHIVEVAGSESLNQSINACAHGGHIAMIGILGGVESPVNTGTLIRKQIRLIGTVVGNRDQQQDMVRAIEANNIKPVIDRVFSLDQLAEAFRYQETGAHFGKICVEY